MCLDDTSFSVCVRSHGSHGPKTGGGSSDLASFEEAASKPLSDASRWTVTARKKEKEAPCSSRRKNEVPKKRGGKREAATALKETQPRRGHNEDRRSKEKRGSKQCKPAAGTGKAQRASKTGAGQENDVGSAPVALADPLTRLHFSSWRSSRVLPHLLKGKVSRPVRHLGSLRPGKQAAAGREAEVHSAAAQQADIQAEHEASHDIPAEPPAAPKDGEASAAAAASPGSPLQSTKDEQAGSHHSPAEQADEQLPAALPPGAPSSAERLADLKRVLRLRFCSVADTTPGALRMHLHAKVEQLLQLLCTDKRPAVPAQPPRSRPAASTAKTGSGTDIGGMPTGDWSAGEDQPLEDLLADVDGLSDPLDAGCNEDAEADDGPEQLDMSDREVSDASPSAAELFPWEQADSPKKRSYALRQRRSVVSPEQAWAPSSPSLLSLSGTSRSRDPDADLLDGDDTVSMPDFNALGDSSPLLVSEDSRMHDDSPGGSDVDDFEADDDLYSGEYDVQQADPAVSGGFPKAEKREDPDPVRDFTNWCANLPA